MRAAALSGGRTRPGDSFRAADVAARVTLRRVLARRLEALGRCATQISRARAGVPSASHGAAAAAARMHVPAASSAAASRNTSTQAQRYATHQVVNENER